MVAPMMGPPGMPPMGEPVPQVAQSPQIDMALMRDAFEAYRPSDPYGAYFRKPKRPDMQKMYDLGLRKFEDYDIWRSAVRHDLMMLRMAQHGIFKDDQPMLEAGILDDYESTGLVDELNLAVSFLSGLNYRFMKHPCGNEKYAYENRQIQLAAQWLYELESRQHTNLPEMSTRVLIPKILLPYGRIVKSRTINRMSEEWESPFTVRYLDPAQVIYDRGPGGGLKRLWRIYSTRVEDLIAAYGDFSLSVEKAIKDKYPEYDEDTEIINVCEYWDTWYRFVYAGDGICIIPVTEHKYGEVPFTIGLGPLGEPQATRMPEETGVASLSRETFRENIPHKSVGFVRFMKKPHIIREAIMTRYLYAQKIALWPPVIIKEGLNSPDTPQPDLEPYPNQPNYLGDDRDVQPYPFPQRPADTAALMASLDRDSATSRAPQSAYGLMDQSNISGTANKQAISAGRHLWQQWAISTDDFLGSDATQAMRIWNRVGNDVIYGRPDRTRQFTVPNPKPRKGESKSFDLDPATIAKVGPNVYVKSDATDFSDTVRANTFKLLNESGFDKKFISEKLYATDYTPEMEEEWREEQIMNQMFAHPKFMEIFGVPLWAASELEEHEGDEDYQNLIMAGLQGWMKAVAEPAMMEVELQKMQMQGQLMQAQQQQQMQMLGGGPQPGTGNAPTAEQSFSEDQGPGSQSGVQGGPRGPVGPRDGGQG